MAALVFFLHARLHKAAAHRTLCDDSENLEDDKCCTWAVTPFLDAETFLKPFSGTSSEYRQVFLFFFSLNPVHLCQIEVRVATQWGKVMDRDSSYAYVT